MSYYDEDTCDIYCLTTCYFYIGYFRCQYNLTISAIISYVGYTVLAVILIVVGFVIFSLVMRKKGYIKEKTYCCCFRYIRKDIGVSQIIQTEESRLSPMLETMEFTAEQQRSQKKDANCYPDMPILPSIL